MTHSAPIEIRHATTVAVSGRAVLIEGASGAGKSALALALMAGGADLVADDRTALWVAGSPPRVWADAPPGLPALIEARGVGLLPARLTGPVPLAVLIQLDVRETARLPEKRSARVLGRDLPLLRNPQNSHFPWAILQYLREISGIDDPNDA